MSLELIDQTLERANQFLLEQKYDMAHRMYAEALKQCQQSSAQQSGQQARDMEGMIREEMSLLEEIQDELRRVQNPSQRAESAGQDAFGGDEGEDVSWQPSHKTPRYQNARPTPSYANVKPKVYDKPWAQNAGPSRQYNPSRPGVSKAAPGPTKPQAGAANNNVKAGADRPVHQPKAQDGLPTSYEGVDPRFIDDIHAILIKNTGVSYADIAGLEDAKRLLHEAVILPMKVPELFAQGMAPWKGVLLFGPPGTGKTELAKAFATEANCCFFAASASTIMSKYVGESEKVVKALFTIARYHAPSIIFMDEIDALMSSGAAASDNPVGPRLRQEILTQMQGISTGNDVEKHVVVLAATNHPWILDEALRRRLEKRIYLPLPEPETREKLVELKLKTCAFALDESVSYKELSDMLEGYSGADISVITREAYMNIIRRIGYEEFAKNKDRYLVELKITKKDIADAIQKTKPSVSPKDIDKYVQWKNQFASE